jgi:putative heme-binding domain-containing protein
MATRLATDTDPGVRREVAVSMRDQPVAASLGILAAIARGYDGQDRAYLEAFGTGATGKESALYARLRRDLGIKDDPLTWTASFAQLAWRLHVPDAVPAVAARAAASSLSLADRRLAVDTLAFTRDPAASKAMVALASSDSPVRQQATWWLLNRMSNDWAGADYGLRPALKAAGIYDPDAVAVREAVIPPAPPGLVELNVDDVLKLTGDAARGKASSARCLMCHSIGGTGADLGPVLDGWGRGKSPAVIATAIVRPSAEIAQGYEGMELKTKDGLTIQGVLVKDGDPLMMRNMGGTTQIIPADRVATRRRLLTSLMMSAAHMGLTPQDVADLVAFLRAN